MRDVDVLNACVRRGSSYPGWDIEAFATASAYDEETGRYSGLVLDDDASAATNTTLVVKPDIARDRCLRCGCHSADCACADTREQRAVSSGAPGCDTGERGDETVDRSWSKPTRFHGAVALNSERMGRDLMRIQQEVLAHLQNTPGGRISITVELQGHSNGYDEATVRTVNENARTLRFEQFGFEQSEE
ncbi:MAG TPA: hypothetical protein VKP64_11640 [Mycobacteriales bacterium]|nr:hypothetical protein [Mycobacteriales bacterium]